MTCSPPLVCSSASSSWAVAGGTSRRTAPAARSSCRRSQGELLVAVGSREVVVGVNDVVDAYGAAWNETDEAARRSVLEQAWADDGVYCDPTATIDGRDALVAHIGGFHTMLPGARIETSSGVDEHDGWLRFAWTMISADGTSAMEGFDVGEGGVGGGRAGSGRTTTAHRRLLRSVPADRELSDEITLAMRNLIERQ